MRKNFVPDSLRFAIVDCILPLEDMDMNINYFIKSHNEFEDLPFLVVFRTIQILQSMGLLKFTEENKNGMG